MLIKESRKIPLLKRYQIPDCLTIITQRLTKYLTLIENMINNSKEDKLEFDLLTQSLENLRSILNKVNEAVALHQNTAELRRILETFEIKSHTKFYAKNEKDARIFTRMDLEILNNKSPSSNARRILSINKVSVKSTNIDHGKHSVRSSNSHNTNAGGVGSKHHKDVTCLTMTDLIVFLTQNDKSKYAFMNENVRKNNQLLYLHLIRKI